MFEFRKPTFPLWPKICWIYNVLQNNTSLRPGIVRVIIHVVCTIDPRTVLRTGVVISQDPGTVLSCPEDWCRQHWTCLYYVVVITKCFHGNHLITHQVYTFNSVIVLNSNDLTQDNPQFITCYSCHRSIAKCFHGNHLITC